MLKPRSFEAICKIFRDRITSVSELKFSIQTNGTILNDTWLELFREYFVRVGVSIDGDREAHDRYRLDHRSQSTFDRTEQNIRRLVAWAGDEKPLVPATISVLDCRNDYRRIYAYLRGLGIEQMSFLLPDRNIDSGFATREASGKAYGHSLLEIFEAWLTEDNPDI